MNAFLFADLHTSYKNLIRFKNFLINNEDVGLIICAGDIVDMGEPVGYMEEFIKTIGLIGKPFFWVPGNNDFGRSYYKLCAKYPTLEGKIAIIPAEAGIRASGVDPRAPFDSAQGLSVTEDKSEDDTIRLTGVGGSPASWAGQYAGEKMVDRKAIGGSIFVSHIPPPGVHNYIHGDCNYPTAGSFGSAQDGRHAGRRLSDSPLVHICGHFHHQWGCAFLGSTKIIKLAALESGNYAILDMKTLEVKFGCFQTPITKIQ